MNFFQLLTEYPMGNGLGGGGTSIPFFLMELLRNPVTIENEYGRIMLEQGVAGLALWVVFLIWVLTRPSPPKSHPWQLCWRLLWYYTLGSLLLAVLGTGLMTSIPHTALTFMGIGFMTALSLSSNKRGSATQVQYPLYSVPIDRIASQRTSTPNG
jgi:hypothetical protein